jgi:hypothetical protein
VQRSSPSPTTSTITINVSSHLGWPIPVLTPVLVPVLVLVLDGPIASPPPPESAKRARRVEEG